MNIGIILAGGKGTRLKSVDRNKTTILLNGKPLVRYGVDLYRQTTEEIVIVIGAFAQTVKDVLPDESIIYALQEEQKGTGHAAMIAVDAIEQARLSPENVFIGYGDHMMFYTPENLRAILESHTAHKAAISLVSVQHEDPNSLAWGRIIRGSDGYVERIVEQKDATEAERQIDELNAGFYCFDYAFLQSAVKTLTPSPVTNEYYLTDLIEIARNQGRPVLSYSVPFAQVGTGVNTLEQLAESEQMMKARQ